MNISEYAFKSFVGTAVAPAKQGETTTALLAGGWAEAPTAAQVRETLGWHTVSVLPTTPSGPRGDQTLDGSLFNVRCSSGAFSATMITAEAGGPVTNRHNALVASGYLLAPGGLVVMAAHKQALAGEAGDKLAEALLSRCEMAICRVIDGIVFTVFRKEHPRPRYVSKASTQELLARIAAAPSRPWAEVPLNAPPVDPKARIEAVTVSQEWAQKHAASSGLWKSDGALPGQVEPKPVLAPLMPLRKGHLALAIAGGVFGTITVETDEGHLLVKGQHAKREHLEEDGPELKVSREAFAFRLGVLNPQSGTWTMLE
jgi:hypothetical protein